MSQSFAELNSFLLTFRWFAGRIVSVAMVPVVTTMVSGLAPQSARQPLLYTICAAVGLITSFVVFLLFGRSGQRKKWRRLWVSLAVCLPVAAAYGYLFAEFTDTDASDDRYIKGYEYSPDVIRYKKLAERREAAGEDVDDVIRSDRDLVMHFKNDPLNVWTSASVQKMTILVNVFFILSTIAVTAFLSFLMLLLPKPADAPSAVAT